MKIQHVIIAVFVAAIWGFNFAVVKAGLTELPPFMYGAGRFVIALIPIVFYLKKPDVPWRIIGGIGLTLGFLKFGLMFTGMHLGMSSGLSSLILQSQVFFTVALSMLIFRTSITPHQVLGMLVAFVGIGMIAWEMHAQSSMLGFLMLIGAAISWAISNVLYRKAGDVDMFALTIWTCVIPPIPMLACALHMDGPGVIQETVNSLSWYGFWCLVFTACASTWVGSTLWGVLLKNYDATTVAPYSLLVPVFGFTFAWLIHEEALTMPIIIACSLVFLGLIINQWPDKFPILKWFKNGRDENKTPANHKTDKEEAA